jgi:hypothetical protein
VESVIHYITFLGASLYKTIDLVIASQAAIRVANQINLPENKKCVSEIRQFERISLIAEALLPMITKKRDERDE